MKEYKRLPILKTWNSFCKTPSAYKEKNGTIIFMLVWLAEEVFFIASIDISCCRIFSSDENNSHTAKSPKCPSRESIRSLVETTGKTNPQLLCSPPWISIGKAPREDFFPKRNEEVPLFEAFTAFFRLLQMFVAYMIYRFHFHKIWALYEWWETIGDEEKKREREAAGGTPPPIRRKEESGKGRGSHCVDSMEILWIPLLLTIFFKVSGSVDVLVNEVSAFFKRLFYLIQFSILTRGLPMRKRLWLSLTSIKLDCEFERRGILRRP